MAVDIRAAVIVVSYGSADLVERNLAGLSAGSPELDIVVVDCYSGVEERERVRAACERQSWTPVLLDENAGFGGGVNQGAREAIGRGAEVLLVINPDAVIDVESAQMLVGAAAADPHALLAPQIHRPDGSLWSAGTDLYLDTGRMAGVRHRESYAGRPRMFWVSGACFALSRSLWERIDGFDDDYFLYWEDVDLSRKVHDLGGSVRVIEDAVAVHDEGGTHGDLAAGRAKSGTYYYFNIRNRLLFARRRLPADSFRRWRRTALRASWGIILQGGRRQLLTSWTPWRALMHGLRDGRAGVSGPLRG